MYNHTISHYNCATPTATTPCPQTAQDYLESSDSEDEDGEGGGDEAGAEERAQEDADTREEARVQKLWVKRAKRRRVLAEVEESAANSQGPEVLMQEVRSRLSSTEPCYRTL